MARRNIYEDKAMQKFLEKQAPYPFDNTQIKVNSRVICCGSTNTGKTTALFDYIERSPGTFSKVIVFYKESEPIYEYMQALTKGRIEFHDDINAMPSISKMREGMDDDERILLIIDDWIDRLGDTAIRKKCLDMFIRGRKKNISVWVLSQSYYMIPKEFRMQATYLLLFPLATRRDTDMILDAFTASISKEDLRAIYKDATRKRFDFLKIEVAHCPLNKKFSRNFTDFYEIEDESDESDEN